MKGSPEEHCGSSWEGPGISVLLVRPNTEEAIELLLLLGEVFLMMKVPIKT